MTIEPARPPRRVPRRVAPHRPSGHPARQATILLIAVTVLIVALAALSSLGHL